MKALGLFLLILFVKFVTAQPLDWAGDMTVFGTAQNESHPAIAMNSAGLIRAFCVTDGDSLAMRISTNAGAAWGNLQKMASLVPAPSICAAVDDEFLFAIACSDSSAQKRLYRFANGDANWNVSQTAVAPERPALVAAMSIMSDVAFQPNDAYLNLCWSERNGNLLTSVFAQSRDHGATFLPAVVINSASAPAGMNSQVSVTATWSGEEEILHAAVTVDRAGSIPEQVLIFNSTDQGTLWSAGNPLDPSAYAQRNVSCAGWEELLLVVYERQSNATPQRDIFYSYSPDGGMTFSPPVSFTLESSDDFDPRISIDSDGVHFHVFYLTAEFGAEQSTVMCMDGSIASPWDVGAAVSVSDAGSVWSGGGYAATSTALGQAALWTYRFPLGDTDIHFDASWRGNSVTSPVPQVPTQIVLGACYPNPFNGRLTVSLSLNRTTNVVLEISDLLGQSVGTIQVGTLAPGEHTTSLDFEGCSSGSYWIQLQHSTDPPRHVILLQ